MAERAGHSDTVEFAGRRCVAAVGPCGALLQSNRRLEDLQLHVGLYRSCLGTPRSRRRRRALRGPRGTVATIGLSGRLALAGRRALTWLTNRFFGANFTDVATNYKLVRTELLQSLQLRCSGFDLDFELSNRLALATEKIAEVPIDFQPRTYAQGKKIGLRDGLRAFGVILRDWIGSARGR